MKKTVSIISLILICFMLVSPISAAFVNPPITDNAGYLYDSEFAELSDRLNALREKYGIEVAVYTEATMSGYDAMSTADDIYDHNGYGAGEDADGILLYISANPREYWFTTHGKGITVFNDVGIEYLKSEIKPLLSYDDYYGAISSYVDNAGMMLEMAANGEPFDEFPTTISYVLFIVGLAVLIPIIVASVLTGIKTARMKTAVANDRASDYMKAGSMQIAVSRDMFLYSRITKTARPKESSSSTHTSSSGRTHGGGGGSF